VKLYKLTDSNNQTHGATQWGEGIEHTASGKGQMCGPGWLHAYRDPLLAVLMNSAHADFTNPVLWIADGDVGVDDGLKVGCTRLKTLSVIELPIITTEQRVTFAILCALEVCREPSFVKWANAWIDGTDRSAEAAKAAEAAAKAAWAAAADKIDFITLAHKACG
jgi:hypothetical protein